METQMERGEAYLLVIGVVEKKEDKKLKVEDILVVQEFGDAFEALTELSLPRRNPFTISLESGTTPALGVPYEEGEGVDEDYHLAEDVTILLHGRITVPEGGHLRQEILRMAHQSLLSIHP
ncbi:unnamed protein product [Microthlaspi erraticum]|uniref:Uncharacterized protein n=1 Tax=Microthlaspi erraticum TaxID=1685480 RepID=A0A6D2JK54_9BRAS|nr:unnamed protein product [Microthlaspi erraticum]